MYRCGHTLSPCSNSFSGSHVPYGPMPPEPYLSSHLPLDQGRVCCFTLLERPKLCSGSYCACSSSVSYIITYFLFPITVVR